MPEIQTFQTFALSDIYLNLKKPEYKMIAVLQARIGSKRLPGKAFFTFFGQNMVERAIAIAQEIRDVDRVVLATGDKPENLALQPYAENMGAEFFVGSEDNVLERFYHAIEGYEGEYLLRMTCDNYLIQPDVAEGLYKKAKTKNADYAYVAPLSHFSGELVKCEALRSSYCGDYSKQASEHVTWDIRADPAMNILTLPADYLGLNHQAGITLDTLGDLITMKKLEFSVPSLRHIRCLDTLKMNQTNKKTNK